jgi:hypothetical protein
MAFRKADGHWLGHVSFNNRAGFTGSKKVPMASNEMVVHFA